MGLITKLSHTKITRILCSNCKYPLAERDKTHNIIRFYVNSVKQISETTSIDKDHTRVKQKCPKCGEYTTIIV